MNKSQEEGERLLREFGRLVVASFDRSLASVERRLNDKTFPAHKLFDEYLNSLPVQERPIKVAQEGLEIFIHDFMAALQDSDTYGIFALNAHGILVNLKDIPEESLNAEQLYWIDEFSGNERISEKIV